MHPLEEFAVEKKQRIAGYGEPSGGLATASRQWLVEAFRHKYMNNFSAMGRPVIQLPTDIVAMQELIWQVQPDLIIETGIAHGGSLIMYASCLEAIGKGHILGVDVDIRAHNRELIEQHSMFHRISMIEGSSVGSDVVRQVRDFARGHKVVLVVLDSNHTHDHVLAELQAYSPLVSPESYCVVFDTIIEDLPADMFPDRPWGVGNSPKSAIHEFMATDTEFLVDAEFESKLMISAAPGGFLRRTE